MNQENCVINNRYTILRDLGNGATSEVKLVQEQDNLFAVKILNPSKLNIESFNVEVDNLSILKHENIINMIESGQEKVKSNSGVTIERNYIVLDYCHNSELFEYIFYPQRGFGEEISRVLFKQLLSGLKHCHENNIVHRDLKTENLMMSADWQLKIADFGFSTKKTDKTGNDFLSDYVGTNSYASPEVIGKKEYKGIHHDIFSCGVILFVLVTGRFPFVKAHIHDKFYKHIFNEDFTVYWSLIKSNLGNIQLSTSFKELVNAMLTYNPDKRISIDNILSHEWLNGSLPSKDVYTKEFEVRKEEILKFKKKNFVEGYY